MKKGAVVLAVLCSGRRHGYTARALEAAVAGAQSVPSVKVETIRLHDYHFGPCTSCFNCIRRPDHTCTMDDDFGRKGRGVLFRKVREANGLIVADPVHGWGASAMFHVFYERLYPFLWSGHLNGMPFMSISCATNQGMMREAQRTITRWAFTKSFRLIGGLPIHASYFGEALKRARTMGKRLGLAALRDAKGRKKFSDEQRFIRYVNTPWNPVEKYIDNLSNGTGTLGGSLIAKALRDKTPPPPKLRRPAVALGEGGFRLPEAIELLEKAREEFAICLRHWRNGKGNVRAAARHLSRASAFWTHATWKEFLEREVIKARQPAAYRPLPRQ
jgi:multimeric flavodoxin WrbA